MKPIVVFDVESVGLHGDGFAVGAVVLDLDTGERLEEMYAGYVPSLDLCQVNDKWVAENVIPALPEPTAEDNTEVQAVFWKFWRGWADQGAMLLADCAWPVEANFLSECLGLDWPYTEWQGPYPLLDLSSVLFAYGKNPIGSFDRRPDELPAHNPLNDARQSARVLYETIKRHGR